MSWHRLALHPCAVFAIGLALLSGRADANVVFNLDTGGNTIDPQALAGFTRAASLWSSSLSDNITVNINIGFKSLGSSILGQASTIDDVYSYSSFQSALASRSTSANDALAVGSLQTGSTYDVLLNGTTDTPGLHTATFDQLTITNANAKALGLIQANATASDAAIAFNSDFTFDFNPDDGIASGQFDFVGIAAHEIGHSLGFISGVDALDFNFNTNPASDFNGNVTSLDMFRSSNRVSNGTIDWAADNADKYLSLDRGATNLGLFSNGVDHGDGRQASHWKDDLGLGIMDPTAAPGEKLVLTNRDLIAFDVIGYSLVPEPGSVALMGIGVVALVVIRVRKSSRKAA